MKIRSNSELDPTPRREQRHVARRVAAELLPRGGLRQGLAGVDLVEERKLLAKPFFGTRMLLPEVVRLFRGDA